MKIKESEDVSSYVTHVQTVMNQLKYNGETLTDAEDCYSKKMDDGP